MLQAQTGLNVEAFQEHWRVRHATVFVKLPGLRRYVQSHTLLSGYRKREPAYKNIEFAVRRPDMPVSEFQAYWRNVHGPLGAAIPLLRR